jgi:pilus assembly protein FimV
MGRASSHTTMGEGLAFTVPLRLDAGEHIEDECLAADVFFGDDKVAAANVHVRMSRDSRGEPQIKVFTSNAVSEPVVTVYVVAGCQSRITRKFVALADPPGMQMPLAATDDLAAESVPTSPALTAIADRGAVAQSSDGRQRSARKQVASEAQRKGRHARRDATVTASAQGARVATHAAQVPGRPADAAAPRSLRLSAPPSVETARLELDPVAADALVAPQLAMGRTLTGLTDPDDSTPELLARRASAAARWRALQSTPEQLARDQARLAELEHRFAQLQAPASAPAQVAAVPVAPVAPSQVVVPDTTDASHASRTMGLIGLAIAALVGGAYVFWRGRVTRGRADEAWWQEQAGETLPPSHHEAEPNDPHPTTVEFVHVPEALLKRAGHGATVPVRSGADAPDAAPRVLPSSLQSGAQFTSMFASLNAQSPEPLRAVAVEELIDLEQQAEFFVVLGQDDAAIELLEGYAQHTLGGSPLPFLKLLELYRRLDRRQDYERTQQAFDARFNARAPGWDADMQHGHSLADYPEVLDRLQTLWQQPAQAMAVLEKSLTRPSDGEDTFDLPAYRELLLLYAVARDLAERSGPAGRVDVLLPLGAEPANPETEDQGDVSPLMATRPLPVGATAGQPTRPLSAPAIEVDLQLDDEPVSSPAEHRH